MKKSDNKLIDKSGYRANVGIILINKLKTQNKSQSSDVEKHFQKNENKKRLQDSMLERKIINFLIQYVKAKDVKISTKELRKNATQRVQNG